MTRIVRWDRAECGEADDDLADLIEVDFSPQGQRRRTTALLDKMADERATATPPDEAKLKIAELRAQLAVVFS